MARQSTIIRCDIDPSSRSGFLDRVADKAGSYDDWDEIEGESDYGWESLCNCPKVRAKMGIATDVEIFADYDDRDHLLLHTDRADGTEIAYDALEDEVKVEGECITRDEEA